MPNSMIEMVRDQRDAIIKPTNDLLASAEAEGRSLTADESKSIDDVLANPALIELDARIAQLTDLAERNAKAAVNLPTNVRVGREEAVYRRNGGNSFFADLYARQFSFNSEAADRLHRHEQHLQAEHRDTLVSGLGGMVPPQYLTDLYAPTARAGRPFLNSLTSRPLPNDGVSFVVPRGTTTATGGFVTEGSAFIEVDSTVSNDNPLVQLIGAYSDISRTLFERGGSVTDDIIMSDLMDISEVASDRSALQGTSTTLGYYGVLASVASGNKVAYTDASPTVAEMWPKIADAIQRVNTNRFMPATAIYMTPARWGWITAAVDTAGRPLFNFNTNPTAASSVGLGTAVQYGQVVGNLQGLPVITDANLPTTWASGVASTGGTEDVILIARTPDIILMEDAMMRFTFEQAPPTAPGQVRLAAGRYGWFHAGRYPSALATVTGTGLVAPTF